MQPSYDVIIIGAGPAGSGLAYWLARQNLSVLLVDKHDFPRDKTCGDALSPRAQHFLALMGLRDSVPAEAHHAPAIQIYAPNGACARTEVNGAGDMPDRTLVLPRFRFDHMLQSAAVAAGARFSVGHVRTLTYDAGRVSGIALDGRTVLARLVVIATGAATGLHSGAGLAPRAQSVHTAAVRRYYDDVRSLGDELMLFLNDIPLPGYSWVFPTQDGGVNMGYWYSGTDGTSSRGSLPGLVATHPQLSALLHGATARETKSYPIRTDYRSAPKLAPGVMAIGEAAGLVNPFTGEGIDYALESAHMAAEVIVSAMATTQYPSVQDLKPYIGALRAHFLRLFLLMDVAHDYLFAPRILNNIFGGGARRQRTVDELIAVCFGAAEPLGMLKPRILRDVAGL